MGREFCFLSLSFSCLNWFISLAVVLLFSHHSLYILNIIACFISTKEVFLFFFPAFFVIFFPPRTKCMIVFCFSYSCNFFSFSHNLLSFCLMWFWSKMACSLSIFSTQGKEVPFSFFNVPSPSALGGKSSLKDVKIKCDIEVRRLLLGFEALLQLVRKK